MAHEKRRSIAVGTRLRNVRLSQNLRLKELAEDVGKPEITLSRMEAGHNVGVDVIYAVLDRLDLYDTIVALLGSKGTKAGSTALGQRNIKRARKLKKKD